MSGHWYTHDGTPMHQVLNQKQTKEQGKNVYRDTNLKDAKKLDLLPSVTGILHTGKPDWLVRYDEHMLWQALFQEPRQGDIEPDDHYRSRIKKAFWAEAEKPSKLGTKIHGVLEDLINGYVREIATLQIGACVTQFKEWYSANVGEVVATEQTLASAEWGFGGTVDFQYTDKDGSFCITDFKSKRTTKGTKIEQTLDQKRQLVAYALLTGRLHVEVEGDDVWICGRWPNNVNADPPRLGNLYLSTTEPNRWEYHEVPQDEIPELVLDVRDLVRLWKRANGFI